MGTTTAKAELLGGRYEVRTAIGRGGQGEVFRAFDHRHGRDVALKVRPAGRPELHDVVLSEARVLLGVRPHPAVATARHDFFDGDRHCLVMDWVDGPTLSDLLIERGRPGLPLSSVSGWIETVAGALEHLHAHRPPIVHQDVKPSNVILALDGTAVLVDFGCATDGGDRATSGTTAFLAPELLDGASPGPASDVYALAVTAFQLLTGSLPEPGDTPDWPSVPAGSRPALQRAFVHALSVDPSSRPTPTGFATWLRLTASVQSCFAATSATRCGPTPSRDRTPRMCEASRSAPSRGRRDTRTRRTC